MGAHLKRSASNRITPALGGCYHLGKLNVNHGRATCVPDRFDVGRTGMIWLRLCWLCAVLLVVSTFDATAATPRAVLLLHSFGRDFAPFANVSATFREALITRSSEPIELYELSIDTARVGQTADETPVVQHLNALFSARKLDMVVTFGGPAASFLQRHRSRLFPTTPALITGVEQRRIQNIESTKNNTAVTSEFDTAVSISIDIARYIENILRLRPATTNVAVVLGNSPFEKFWVDVARREFRRFEGRTAFTWFNELPFDEMLKRAAALPPQSAIFYSMVVVDANGVPYEQDRTLARLHAVANAPIFGMADYNFGQGIVGGPLFSTQAVGETAANVGIRILKGEAPGSIKSPPLQLETPVYDWRELRRWDISESRLPAGSEVRFRGATMWEQYRTQMIAGVGILLLQAAMITWLLIEQHRRQRAEVQSRQHLLEVIHLNRSIGAGVMSASIAHELNQPLGAILSNAEAGEILLSKASPDLTELKAIFADIRRADQRAGDIIARLRRLLKKRTEFELQQFDLNDTIRDALDILGPEARKSGVVMAANQANFALNVRADQVHLQQVLLNLAINGMESMRNSVSVTRKMIFESALIDDSEVEITVADTGAGIPEDKLTSVFETFFTTKENGTGLGLSIARTIIETYGGRIWAENRPGGGAVFRFTLPLAGAPA